MANGTKSSDSKTRNRLAVGIIGASILGIVVISGIAIWLAGGSRPATSRLVFSAVLPLLGTWVGTVLAFYFARDNLQAATESTLRLAGIETATPVTQVMIPESEFVTLDVGLGGRAQDVQLSAVQQEMTQGSTPRRRLPIRNSSGSVLYVIHDSTLTAYAATQGQMITALSGTIGDLLNFPEFKELVEAIGFVGEKATVGDARSVMSSIKNCNDVFVTPSGGRDQRAIGWLTNTRLAGIQRN